MDPKELFEALDLHFPGVAAKAPPALEPTPGRQAAASQTAAPGTATPSAVSRVKAYAGEMVTDAAGYTFRVTADGAFVVTGGPTGTATGRVITSDGRLASAWTVLAQRLFARPPGRAQVAATRPAPAGGGAIPGPGPDNIPPAPAPAPAAGTALDSNLVAAQDLAEHFNVPHSYDAKPADDLHDQARVTALKNGDTKALKTVVCSEFTLLSLRRASVDMNQRYRDPRSGHLVAFADGKVTRFVDLYMVIQNWNTAGHAVIAAQRGGLELVEPDSDRAKQLKVKVTEPFLYDASGETKAAVADGDLFGAAAAAVSVGGKRIDQVDRKPGDVQQRLDTARGTTRFAGHSSQIWAVRGPGIAHLGVPGAPRLLGKDVPKDLEPGWYEADGKALVFEILPETDPATVAAFAAEWVQLIEATNSATDATRIAPMRQADAAFDPEAEKSAVTSTARLPTSKWLGWTPHNPDGVRGL